MNKVILVGRLTKDPDVRYTQTGKCVASFSLAVDRGYGENKDTDFIPIVVWDKIAEICGNNLTKGQKVLIDGRLQVRSYDDKTGQKRWVTEVIGSTVEFLERRQGTPNSSGQNITRNKDEEGSFGPEIFPDDDVPF